MSGELLVVPEPRGASIEAIREVLAVLPELRAEALGHEDGELAMQIRERVAALARFVGNRKGKKEVLVEARRTEILIGHLLRRRQQGVRLSEALHNLDPQLRDQFRRLAEHEQFVEKQLKEGARPERPHLLKAIEHAGRPALEGHVDLREGDFREVLAELSGIDVILTDPPYGVAHLELYVALAKWAPKVLNAGGLLAVMCGEYFLPDVIGALGTGPLPYRWTVAYRVPGNAVRVHPARVATMWKPVLLYGEGRDLGADVVTSDAVEKDLHDWGQSESGMVALVDRLSEPGDHICDPFMGSGTTGWAAVARGRSFTGTDIDPTVVLTARSRVKAKS